MRKEDLLKIIQEPGLIDYQSLALAEALKLIPELLEDLLKKAHHTFDQLVEMQEDQIDFTNFFEPFLTEDRDLGILFQSVSSLNSTHTNETTRKIIQDFQPKLVEYHNKVNLNRPFYDKLKYLEKQDLDKDQKRSLGLVILDMEVSGVHLGEEKRNRIQQINKKLSELGEAFSQNVTDSRADFSYEIEDESTLSEMPESDLQTAKDEAKKRKSKLKYVFTLSQPSYMAVVRYCSDSKIREKFYKANHTLASLGKWDNRPLALEILTLRQEKAELLGFKNYTEYVLQQRMAKNIGEIEGILNQVSQKAGKAAKNNLLELEEYAGKKLKAWDLAYYSEKLKKEKYKVDEKLVRQYFSLEQVIEGLFLLVKQLFEVDVIQVDRESYHPDVRVYEVSHQGKLVAYYLLDPHARPEKRGGAWADDLRTGHVMSGDDTLLPIVINVCNFPKGANGKPALLTHRDVETLFHEFGHALHVMLSSGTLPNLNGFHTEWDFVEMPSQIMENWCWEKEPLELFAKHYETGEVIPDDLIEKLKKTKNFMSGLFLARQNEFGFLDLNLHSQPEKLPKNPDELDQMTIEIANSYSVVPKFEGYKMYASFSHIFAGGYAAGYYSYVWAEILEADIFESMQKTGVMNPETGKRYVEEILSQGSKKDAGQIFHDFMGREPQVAALFKKHGIE